MARQIRLVPYDANWPLQFETARENLIPIFGDLAKHIYHFGSTSVPGMASKPTLDIMVIVKNISQVDTLNSILEQQGYIAKGENGIHGRRYFIRLAKDDENHLEHIHCYEDSNPHVENELLFCSFLRQNQDAFNRYLAIKTEAAKYFSNSPEAYAAHKAACIQTLLKEAQKQHISL